MFKLETTPSAKITVYNSTVTTVPHVPDLVKKLDMPKISTVGVLWKRRHQLD
jgi:hypothetical protein